MLCEAFSPNSSFIRTAPNLSLLSVYYQISSISHWFLFITDKLCIYLSKTSLTVVVFIFQLPQMKHQWPLILLVHLVHFLPWDKTTAVAFRPIGYFWNALMLFNKAVQVFRICAWSKQNTFSLEFASAWLPTQWTQDYFVKKINASKELHFQKLITGKQNLLIYV